MGSRATETARAASTAPSRQPPLLGRRAFPGIVPAWGEWSMEFQQAVSHDVSSSPSNLPAHVDIYRAGATSLLVGRHREQAVLRTQLKRMLEGRAGLVLVGGEG